MPTSAEAQERFEQEQRAYWQQRDELLQKYAGKWVALVGGQVVACGDQMNKVAAEAWRKTGSGLMYVNLVGGRTLCCACGGLCRVATIAPMPHLSRPLRRPSVMCAEARRSR